MIPAAAISVPVKTWRKIGFTMPTFAYAYSAEVMRKIAEFLLTKTDSKTSFQCAFLR